MRKLWRRLLGKPDNSLTFGESHTLAVAPDVHASLHDDGLALLDVSTGKVFLCNCTGARIWQGIAAGLQAGAISEQISRECDVPLHLVARHTSSFLQEVERRGLVIRKRARL